MLKEEFVSEAVSRLEEKRTQREKEARHRAFAAEEKEPRLRALGMKMRSVSLRILEESMRGGEDLLQRIDKIREENLAAQKEYGDLLERMGLERDHTKPKRDCPLCHDSGFVDGRMCRCLKREVVSAAYRASGIGRLLEKQTFDSFDLSFYSKSPLEGKRYSPRDIMEEIFLSCKNYAENFATSSPSLLFIGGTGLGKTHLSSAIAGKVIEKGFDVVYETAPAVAAIFEKERFENEDEAEGTKRLFEAELLILDDLGTEAAGKAGISAIYRLINHRASVLGLPTIISTNLSYRQLEKQYDTAILSRLLGEFEVKLFQGSDIRMAKLQK